MKSKFLFSCLLVFVNVWNLIVSADIDFKKYEYCWHVWGYRCIPKETAFEADDIDPVTCGTLCYINKNCLSFFYLHESNKCVGCRHKYTSNTRSHEKLWGSHYYRPLPELAHTVTRECFDVGYARKYRGITHIKTREGIPCQRWDSKEPHEPSFIIYYEVSFPEKSFKDADNYCRDPHLGNKPWCYTTDPNVIWDFCNVPQCSNRDCYKTDYSSVYQGYTNVTKDNLECQRWDKQSPHTHTFTDPKNYPDVSISAANNYCRDPGGRGKPWCFTTGSKLWDYCHVEMCPLDYCYRNHSWEYQGQMSYAESGAECQRWDSNYPHEHQYGNMISKFPDDSVSAAGHYCRDPSRTGRPWCYITDPEQEWGWCHIEKCK